MRGGKGQRDCRLSQGFEVGELVEFYGLKTCDTCRKALKSLRAAGIDVTVLDVRDDGVPQAVLVRAVDDLGADYVLNTRSTTWREMSDGARKSPLLDLLTAHPILIKRPLIIGGDHISVGWGGDILAALEARARAS
jgi:Spx/MgsR family transcriptional regulator